jgi:FkbM family methyltransferase
MTGGPLGSDPVSHKMGGADRTSKVKIAHDEFSMKTVTKMKAAAALYRIISAAHKLLGKGDSVQVVRKGLLWDLDLSEGIDLAIFLFGQFESGTAKVLERLVQPGSIVLDIGANVGAHTLPLARLVGPKGKVYAFEPTEYAFGKLKRNLQLNPALNLRVIAEQIRLTSSGTNDPAEIYSSWKVIGQEPRHPKHLGIPKSTAGAQAITLDEYRDRMGIQKIDFVKLDVDGFEVDVIRSGKDTLRRCQPAICMEISPYVLQERGTSSTELVGVLQESGFQLIDLKTRAPITDPSGKLKTSIPDGAGINVLVLPQLSN